MEKPLLSIVLLTHNHQTWIRQCLESTVSQVTDFPVEILIGEDASTDHTRAICREFAKKHENVYLIEREKNLGLPDNLIKTVNAARGEFIAFQEGDDYWLDKSKLQKQVNFLQEHPEYVACTHNTRVLYSHKAVLLSTNHHQTCRLKDAANGRIFHTNTWVIRKEAMPDFSKYRDHLICWDILMELKVLEKGPVYAFPEAWSVWRKHPDGNSERIMLREQYHLFCKLYRRLLDESSGDPVKQGVYRRMLMECPRHFALSMASKGQGKWTSVTFQALMSIWRSGRTGIRFLYQILKS